MQIKDYMPSFLFIVRIYLAIHYGSQISTFLKSENPGNIARIYQIKRCFSFGQSSHLNKARPEPIQCQGCSSCDHDLEQCPSSWGTEEQPNAAATTVTGDSISQVN